MGIWIAAVITTILSAAFYGFLIYRLALPQDRRWLLLAALCALPLQPLALVLVRAPLHLLLLKTLGIGPVLTTITLFYAPLTEEPAKWLVLLIPFVRRGLTPGNAIALALAIGVGFGIGEAWFIASQIAQAPQAAGVPFYMFTGYLGERFAVCFVHGAFIAFAVRQLAEHRSFLLGGLLGMTLHFALNFPIFLIVLDPLGLGPVFWTRVSLLWFATMLFGLIAFVAWLSRGQMRQRLLGSAVCPECHQTYERPLLAPHLGFTRYERCPHCRHFHWVPWKIDAGAAARHDSTSNTGDRHG